jgi:hypothetical protein
MNKILEQTVVAGVCALALCGAPSTFSQATALGGAASLRDDKKAKALLDEDDARFGAGELQARLIAARLRAGGFSRG